MQKGIATYLVIILLLLVYINRGLFVSSAYEMGNQGYEETNSVIELVMQLVAGQGNDIDEDGDSTESYNTFNFTQLLICPNFIQVLKQNLFPENVRKRFCIFSHTVSSLSVYGQIDHPPES